MNMPRKPTHDGFEKAVIGRITGMTDIMDMPSRIYLGHHQKFFHDVPQMLIIAMINGGNILENIEAGLVHIMLDKILKHGRNANTQDRKGGKKNVRR
jgi:hypothetical protein